MTAKWSLQHEVGKQDPFDSPEQEAFLNVSRTQHCLGAEFNTLFRLHRLTPPQYNVLRIVRGSGKTGIPSQTIGQRMVANDPDVTNLIDRLEKRKLVTRHRSDQDRRVIRIQITPDGRKLLTKLDPQVMALHQNQLGHMTKKRLALLSELLVEARQGTGNNN